MTNLIGQTLLDQFRVDKFIASGGMGSVYRVWDLKRNVPLAMKVLHSELAEDPHIFKRFKREANALKKLTHPNIVQFYGLFQTIDFAFILERYVDGPCLKDILREKKRKPLPINEALIYLKALCAALGYAHASGVVHCDVKPGNVIIDQGGNIYLTDFGIARHAESSTTTLGSAGTPAYMSPEQILGKAVTPAADIYALGVILFEMLTGRRLFRDEETGTEKSGSTLHEKIRHAHLHTPPPSPRTINSAIPVALAMVVLKSLNKEPSDRYSTTPDFFTAVCEAVGLAPGTIGDRVIISNLPPEFVSTSISTQISMSPQPQIAVLTRRFRSLPAWQSIGILVLAASFCILLGLGTLKLSPFLLPEPTNTNTASPTKTTTPTATFTPTLTPTITFTPPPTPIQYFTEGFNDQLQGWKNFTITNNDRDLKYEVSNGFLNLDLTDEYLWTYFLYAPVSYDKVRVTVKVENRGKNFGTLIICNFTGQEWYEFRILSSGLYSIYHRKFDLDGKHASYQTQITNGGATEIKSGQAINEYAIDCVGNELTLYINGRKKETVTPRNQILRQGRIGIGAYSDIALPVSVGIDEVRVSQP